MNISKSTKLITPGYTLTFILVTSLFFLWALPNNLNDILIPQFMKSFELNRLQAGLVQSAFYLGYFIFAIPAALIMDRFGYKAGLLAGAGLQHETAAGTHPQLLITGLYHHDPMHRSYPMIGNRIPIAEQIFPRCGAKTRKGTPCQCPALFGKNRCRLHGGLSLSGKDHPNYKTGRYTGQGKAELRMVRHISKLLYGKLTP